ncbi:MAG: hypothetical protein ACXW11_07035, partial [Methylotenera sp.]
MIKARTADDQRTYAGWVMLLGMLLCLAALWGGNAYAAKGGGGRGFPPPRLLSPAVPPQFDLTGFIQEATLDTGGSVCQPSDLRLAGGTFKVNGITVIVP